MKSKRSIFSIAKIALACLFIASAVFIAVYPFSNQQVLVEVDDNTQIVEESFKPDELKSINTFSIPVKSNDILNIREIRVHRLFKSIAVDKIPTDRLYQYAELIDGNLVFNESACELLLSNSKSFYMERLLLLEVVLIFILILWIAVNALQEKSDPNDYNNHGPIYELKKFISEMKKYWEYMIYAAKADLKAEVANSYLNRLWWLLEPTFNMMVYVIVFGRVMGNSIQNYATFVFSALLMWNFFSKTINYSVKCVRNNRDIVTKVYVPKHVLLISNMILNLMKLVFSLIVLVPMLIIFRVHIGMAIIWIIAPYVLMLLIAFAGGMIFLHFGVYVDDLSYAVGILLQMLMFLSGAFYDVITSLPTPLNTIMLCLNPVAMFIDTMRNALLNNLVTNVPQIIIWSILSLLIGYIGIHIVYKNENGYVKVI